MFIKIKSFVWESNQLACLSERDDTPTITALAKSIGVATDTAYSVFHIWVKRNFYWWVVWPCVNCCCRCEGNYRKCKLVRAEWWLGAVAAWEDASACHCQRIRQSRSYFFYNNFVAHHLAMNLCVEIVVWQCSTKQRNTCFVLNPNLNIGLPDGYLWVRITCA